MCMSWGAGTRKWGDLSRLAPPRSVQMCAETSFFLCTSSKVRLAVHQQLSAVGAAVQSIRLMQQGESAERRCSEPGHGCGGLGRVCCSGVGLFFRGGCVRGSMQARWLAGSVDTAHTRCMNLGRTQGVGEGWPATVSIECCARKAGLAPSAGAHYVRNSFFCPGLGLNMVLSVAPLVQGSLCWLPMPFFFLL